VLDSFAVLLFDTNQRNDKQGVNKMSFFVFIGAFILAIAVAAFLTENFTNPSGVAKMKTLFLGIIAACAFAHTFAIYESESGGVNLYFGNFGYHIANGESE